MYIKFFKRVFDIICSSIGVIILSPVLVGIAIAIKIDSKGPVLFKQQRVGKNQEVFNIYKFRTMIVNAENIGDGLTIKCEKDYRITKKGVFLRKTSLDELPQLFNVILGNMSLVGPRPPVTYFPYQVGQYDEHKAKRFNMHPGITGLNQITVRNSVSWDERIEIDIKYIENLNIWLDLKILFKTLFKVVKPNAIYFKDITIDNNKTSVIIKEEARRGVK
jgi:undecaprenyl phosphate N,N'-diacetylbacillosamine 1-phosphate transferase